MILVQLLTNFISHLLLSTCKVSLQAGAKSRNVAVRRTDCRLRLACQYFSHGRGNPGICPLKRFAILQPVSVKREEDDNDWGKGKRGTNKTRRQQELNKLAQQRYRYSCQPNSLLGGSCTSTGRKLHYFVFEYVWTKQQAFRISCWR